MKNPTVKGIESGHQKIDAKNNKLLQVSKLELTSGDQSGEVYLQLSKGAAFLLTDRKDAIKFAEEEAKSKSANSL